VFETDLPTSEAGSYRPGRERKIAIVENDR